jgi:hypothetical protein
VKMTCCAALTGLSRHQPPATTKKTDRSPL